MQRPLSIVWFERCYLGALAIGVLATALGWRAALEKMAEMPQMANLGEDFGRNIMVFGAVFSVVITLLLWYFAARQRAVVAKWVITVFFALNVLFTALGFLNGSMLEGVPSIVRMVSVVLNGIAVWQLFKPDALVWFGEKPGTVA